MCVWHLQLLNFGGTERRLDDASDTSGVDFDRVAGFDVMGAGCFVSNFCRHLVLCYLLDDLFVFLVVLV